MITKMNLEYIITYLLYRLIIYLLYYYNVSCGFYKTTFSLYFIYIIMSLYHTIILLYRTITYAIHNAFIIILTLYSLEEETVRFSRFREICQNLFPLRSCDS